ncbi:MAG: 3-dehydroquinate synthase [Eubacteriales bacterium]|jgi:3-dehydroquinate synthase
MENEITIQNNNVENSFTYNIVWRSDFSDLAACINEIEGISPHKICVVTDSNVAPLYLNQVKSALQDTDIEVFTWIFPAGEESKNLTTVSKLYRFLIENHFERKDLLAALGGGVTGDLTGFAAATYLRGIDFIQVPTTLLAQVDSSVGGKTGVDYDEYKNMVGAFHQPRLVYMNMSVLKTLPDDQFASGMGEVLKSAEIRSEYFFRRLEKKSDRILARDPEILSYIIRQCCEIKGAVVEEDPNEHGVRAILNFGHTLGHAIEKCKNFELLHGQCVAIGTVGAAWISMKRGLIPESVYYRIIRLNNCFGLPVSVTGLTAAQIVATARSDKKMENGKLKFILLDGLGNAIIDKSVTEAELISAARVLTGEDKIS